MRPQKECPWTKSKPSSKLCEMRCSDGSQPDGCTSQRKMGNCAHWDYQIGQVSSRKKSCGSCSALTMNLNSVTTHTVSDQSAAVTRPYGRSRNGTERHGS